MAGPYNIDDDINAGDPGQLAWAESVAQAVNDLDLRVVDVETGTNLPTPNTLVKRDADGRFRAFSPDSSVDVANKQYVDNTVFFAGGTKFQDTAALDAYDLDSTRGTIANGILDMGAYTGISAFDGLFVGIPLVTHLSGWVGSDGGLRQVIEFTDQLGAKHEVFRTKIRSGGVWGAWSAWEEVVAGGGGDSGMEGVWSDPIASGKVRVGGLQLMPNNWKFVDAGRVYYYPVYYATTFGVSDLGVSLRGSAAGGTAYFGLQDATGPDGGPGDIVAQANVATDTSGWKNVSITPVTGLPAGWYWHAFMATASLDVFGGQPLAVIDADTMEWAVRDGEWRWRGKASSSAGLTSLPTDPATIGAEAAIIPMVGVRFN